MKNLKIISSFCLLFLTMACNDSDDKVANYGSDLNGIWKLTKSSGGITGAIINYPQGTEIWTFNTSNQTLNVVSNSNGPLITGNYTYSFIASDVPDFCPLTLLIDGSNFGCYSISNGVLSINQEYADGFNYEFVK